MYSGNYLRFLNSLRENGLIEGYSTDTSKDSYTTARATNDFTMIKGKERKPVAKKMRLCPKYSFVFSFINKDNIKINSNNNIKLQDDFKLLPTFCQAPLTQVSYEYSSKSKKEDDVLFEQEFSDMVSKVNIDYQKLYKKAQDICDNIDVKKYIASEYEDMDNVVPVTVVTWGSSVPMSISSAFKLAESRYETLFKVKGRYYIAGREQFSERLKTSKYASYVSSIDRLMGGDLTAKRNGTNRRLDTNFTNMKSDLFGII
jgi:hypothetical protein